MVREGFWISVLLGVAGFTGMSVLTGCGNMMNHPARFAPESSYLNITSSAENGVEYGAFDGPFQCPHSANIVPDYDRNLDGSGHFTACSNQDLVSRVLIHGETSESDSICAYPVEIVDDENIFVKPDTQGLPWYRCGKLTAQGVQLDFPDIRYNALIVVEKHRNLQMSECLIGTAPCPDYSFGRFR